MNMPRKQGLAFYGIILSAIHFAAAAFLSNLPLLMLRFEDMVGSGDTKPYWPPSRIRDVVQTAGDILRLPAGRVLDSCPRMPYPMALALIILSSCLWGFGLALVLRLLLNRHHATREPHAA